MDPRPYRQFRGTIWKNINARIISCQKQCLQESPDHCAGWTFRAPGKCTLFSKLNYPNREINDRMCFSAVRNAMTIEGYLCPYLTQPEVRPYC